MFKFDFAFIRRGLNKNDRKAAKAVEMALDAAQDLTEVNNNLLTMQSDAEDRAEKYTAIAEDVKVKRTANSAMIDVLKQVVSAGVSK